MCANVIINMMHQDMGAVDNALVLRNVNLVLVKAKKLCVISIQKSVVKQLGRKR